MKRPEKIKVAVVVERYPKNKRRWVAAARAEAKKGNVGYVRSNGTGDGASSDVAGKRALEDAIRRLIMRFRDF